MKKIKVIHLVQDLNIGGLERIIAILVKGINKDQFAVEVWCLVSAGKIAEELLVNGIIVKTLGFKGYRNPLNFLKLAKLLKNGNAEIIHMHGFFSAVMGTVAATFARITYTFVHVHTSFYNLSKKNIFINKWISKKATKVIYVSKASREAFLNLGYGKRKKSIVIYNGIDTPKLKSTSGPLKDNIITTIASLYEHKGIKTLIEAMSQVVKKLPNAELRIIGKGPLKVKLQDLTKELDIIENVIFLGERNDVDELINQSSIIVLASLREGLPLSIIEAMAHAKVVIASQVGGIPELIDNEITGYLIKPENSEQLSNKIINLLSDKSKIAEMGQKAKEKFKNSFYASLMIKQIEELYLDSINKNHA